MGRAEWQGVGVKRFFFNSTSLVRVLCAWSAVVTAPMCRCNVSSTFLTTKGGDKDA